MAIFEGIFTEQERGLRISKEKARLKKILKELAPEQAELSANLIEDAAFMACTLDEIRKLVNRDGVIEEYQNGQNQRGLKKSGAVEIYDKMVNTYLKVIKQLCDGLPAVAGKDAADEILRFALGK
jgi:hypothetical protein